MIYFVQAGENGPIKIGHTISAMAKRRAELQIGCPEKIIVLGTMDGDRATEAALHAEFARFRRRGEWFYPIPELIREIKARSIAPTPPTPKPRREIHDHPLARYRAANNLTLEELGAKLGLAKGTLSRYETRRQSPSLKMAMAISERIGVPLKQFAEPKC